MTCVSCLLLLSMCAFMPWGLPMARGVPGGGGSGDTRPQWHKGDQRRAAAPALRVALLGDSITEGYIEGRCDVGARFGSLLGPLLEAGGRQPEILVSGVGGETVRGGLARLAEGPLLWGPHFVAVLYGANDMGLARGARPEVPPGEFSALLQLIVKEIRGAGAEAVILTPVPLEEQRVRQSRPDADPSPWGGLEDLWSEYDRAAREVARLTGAPLVDLAVAFGDSVAAFQGSDGIHPGPRGHAAIARALAGVLLVTPLPDASAPDGDRLLGDLRCRPNPFRPGESPVLEVEYLLGREAVTRVGVYDLRGRRVVLLGAEGRKGPGRHYAFWDGRAAGGGRAAPGIYLVAVEVVSGAGSRELGGEPGAAARRVARIALAR